MKPTLVCFDGFTPRATSDVPVASIAGMAASTASSVTQRSILSGSRSIYYDFSPAAAFIFLERKA